jgi:hypothetical protein
LVGQIRDPSLVRKSAGPVVAIKLSSALNAVRALQWAVLSSKEGLGQLDQSRIWVDGLNQVPSASQAPRLETRADVWTQF